MTSNLQDIKTHLAHSHRFIDSKFDDWNIIIATLTANLTTTMTTKKKKKLLICL